MKKLLIFFIFTIGFAGEWQPFGTILDHYDQVQPGDIIIFDKSAGPLQYGHAAYVNKNKKVVDFKYFGLGYSEAPIYTLSERERSVKLFRYKKMNNELLDQIEEDLKDWSDVMYDPIVPDDDSSEKRIFCSKFVYDIFKDAGEKLSENIEIAKRDTGIIVTPVDIANSNQLEQIIIKE